MTNPKKQKRKKVKIYLQLSFPGHFELATYFVNDFDFFQ